MHIEVIACQACMDRRGCITSSAHLFQMESHLQGRSCVCCFENSVRGWLAGAATRPAGGHQPILSRLAASLKGAPVPAPLPPPAPPAKTQQQLLEVIYFLLLVSIYKFELVQSKVCSKQNKVTSARRRAVTAAHSNAAYLEQVC